MDFLKPVVNIKISNILELVAGIGGLIIISTTSLKGSPGTWLYFSSNFLGLILILAAIGLYFVEKRHETRANLIHGAFNALTEIQQRQAEQLANMGSEEKTKLLIDSLDKSPNRFFQLLKDLLGKQI